MPTSSKGISEIFDTLRDAFLADATLVAMLGSESGIFLGSPNKSTSGELPEICIQPGGMQPQQNDSPGEYRPQFTISVFAKDPHDCYGIVDRLIDQFSIPSKLPAGVSSASWKLAEFRNTDVIYVGSGRMLNSQDQVYQISSLWNSKVVKTAS